MGLLIEWIYWIGYIGGRGRKERLWDGVEIEVRDKRRCRLGSVGRKGVGNLGGWGIMGL